MKSAAITSNIAGIYYEAGILDVAEEFYRSALSLEPENPERLNNLARFLIGNDRNVNEGLELVNKALKYNPENYEYLDTKWWDYANRQHIRKLWNCSKKAGN